MSAKEIVKTICKLWANNLFNGKTKSGKDFSYEKHERILPLLLQVAKEEAGMNETETKEILAEAMLDRVEQALKVEGLADDFSDDFDNDFDEVDLFEADSLEVEY